MWLLQPKFCVGGPRQLNGCSGRVLSVASDCQLTFRTPTKPELLAGPTLFNGRWRAPICVLCCEMHANGSIDFFGGIAAAREVLFKQTVCPPSFQSNVTRALEA